MATDPNGYRPNRCITGNYVSAAEGCRALAGLSLRPVTRVGPAFARLGPGASTAATRSSGAGGFPRDLVRDGWQAAGSSSRRCSAGCPPVPDAAAGGYADGGIRAGRRRRQEDGRDGQGSRRPGGRQQHVRHPARHAPGPPRPHHPACPPPRPEDRPLPAMPPPRQPPPAARAGQTPSSSIRSTRPASLPTVSTGAPIRTRPSPRLRQKITGRAASEPIRSRCRRAPLPATGTREKPARSPSMMPISPGTLTVDVAEHSAGRRRTASMALFSLHPVGRYVRGACGLSCPAR